MWDPQRTGLSLRLNHSSQDLAPVCTELGFVPKFIWKNGDERKNPKGRPLGGTRDGSYCTIDLGDTSRELLSRKIEAALAQLEPHRAVLHDVSSTGGRISFYVGWFLDEATAETLDWRILEKMSQLRIELALNIYGPDASSFNQLEAAVLPAIGDQVSTDPEAVASGDARAVQLQLSRVTAGQRHNSGGGFFTDLEVDPPGEPIKAGILGSVWATIDGFQDPMTFLLFTKDGVLDFLEGASIRDSTVDTDFSAAVFDIIPGP